MSNTQDSSNPTIHSPSSLLNFHHPSSFDTSPATTAELNHSTDTAKHTRNGTSADHPPRPLTKSPSFASRFGFSPKLPQYFPRRSWGPHPAHPGHQNGGSSVESGRTQNSSIPTDSQDSATCQPPPIERDSVDPPALPLKDRTARQNFSDHRDAGQQSHDQSSQDNDGDPQSQRAPRAARSFKRFFKSRSAKEREELEKDRQKRRRSLVELEGPSFDHPLRGTHSRGGAFTKNVARSLRSLNSQASQASVQSLVEAGRTAGSASKSSAIDPAAFLRAPAQPRLSSRPSVDSLSTSSLGNHHPRHHLRTQSSTSSVDSSAPKSSIRSFGFNSSRSLIPGDFTKEGDQATREESVSDSNHSQSSTGGKPRLAKTLWSNLEGEPSKRQLSPVLASPPPDSQPAGSLALSDSADVTPRPGNHLQQKPQEDKSPRPHPLAKTHSEPQVNADLQSIDDTAMVTKTNGDATKSGWKLPFARKVSSKSKRTEEEEEDDWDDYQRGTAAAPSRAVPSHAQKDAKLMAMLGLDNPRALHAGTETPTPTIGRRPKTGPSHDVMDDLRETGYLPRRPEATPGGPGKGSHKLERLLGHEAGSSTPNLAPHTPHTSSSHSGLGHSDGRSSSHSVAPDSAGPAPTSHSTGSPHPGSSHMTSAGESSLHIAETDCPVCLEPLSYRLAGEKPHVIPNCGHALHNACFTAVYGQPEAILAQQGRNGGAGGGPPGMCGVCRKAIVLGGDIEGSNKGSKLAGMMGINEPIDRRRRESDLSHERTDAGTDDPLDSMGHSSFRGAARDQNGIGLHSSPSTRSLTYDTFDAPQQRQQAMVQPTIRVRPEYNTIYRKDPSGQNGKQNMVCVITIEIPSRRPPLSPEEEEAKFRQQWSSLQAIHDREEGDTFDDMDQSRNNRMSRIPALSDGGQSTNDVSGDYGDSRVDGDADGAADGAKESETGHSPNAPGSSHGRDEGGASSPTEEGFSFGATPAASDADPNAAVLEDLRQRIHDWKGQGIEKFGALVLYDSLGVRQDTVVRNFWVYLFHDVLLCITQERRKERGLARLMSGAAGSDKNGAVEDAGPHTPSSGPKPALKLKGRIWLRHIAKVKDNSVPGNYSLSIKLDDDSLDHFVLCLPDQPTLQIWKEKLTELVQAHKPGGQARPPATAPPAAPSVAGSSTSNNSNSTRQNLRELPSTRAATDLANHELPPPPPNANLTRRSTSGSASVASGKAGHSPQTAASQAMPNSSSASRRGNLADSIRRSSRLFSPSYSTGNSIPPQQQWSASGGLDPSVAPPHLLPHTPLDLVLMVSVPVVVQQQNTGVSSSAAMKLRLIRSVLEFVTSHMGPRDRVAIVAYTSGQEGEVRRTALLNVNRERSRAKLADFIECIGKSWDETEEDPFRVDTRRLGGASERTDTVTALNVGLDVVLGRKSKNPCTGMILINDTSDGPVRGHMDLVMARAEAANVPIHCFGFGKSSNPSSLWLISNHTRGSYTFVREWFQLRECVAGCIGSLMSVALDQVKLHISVPGDNHFRVRKLAGLQGAIVSSSGKDVDIELGELRFGEVKELFVELELDFNGLVPFIAHDAGDGRVGVRRVHNAPAIEAGSATDDFMQRLGLNNLSLAESSGDALGVDAIENLIEEVAVFEVDAGFRDPALNMSVTRLSNPTVLTMEVDAHNLGAGADGSPALPADPSVTRRRIEILASEMITRSLLLVSRKNYSAALRIVNETHKIVETVVRSLSSEEGFIANGGVNGNTSIDRRASTNSNGTYSQHGAGGRSKGFHSGPARQRAHLQRQAIASLLGIIEDLELMSDGLESGQRAQFDRDGRNSAAQQAMVLRDQQAWTTRSPTEALRFTSDNGPAFAAHAFAASRF